MGPQSSGDEWSSSSPPVEISKGSKTPLLGRDRSLGLNQRSAGGGEEEEGEAAKRRGVAFAD